MKEARKLASQLAEYGLQAKRRKVLKHIGLVITTLRTPAGIDLPQTAINIRKAYPKMWVDINHRYNLMGSNRDTAIAKKWIKWNKKQSQCGKGLRIGMLDTDVNTKHPALKKQKIKKFSVISNGIKKTNANHGTAIATLLVGSKKSHSFIGLLPTAKLYSVSIFRQQSEDEINTTSEWIIRALDWLVSQKVDVINMSVGGPRNLLVEAVLQRIVQSGVPVIAAAGNGGEKGVAVYPAAQPEVIAVTAIDSDMELYSKATHGKYIDFAAPGVDIWAGNAKGKGKFVSGTSFAVPFVTASIGSLVRKSGIKKAYKQLKKSTRDLGKKGKDQKFGWGLVRSPKGCR